MATYQQGADLRVERTGVDQVAGIGARIVVGLGLWASISLVTYQVLLRV